MAILTKFPGSIIIKTIDKSRLINSIGAHHRQSFLNGSFNIFLIEIFCGCNMYKCYYKQIPNYVFSYIRIVISYVTCLAMIKVV